MILLKNHPHRRKLIIMFGALTAIAALAIAAIFYINSPAFTRMIAHQASQKSGRLISIANIDFKFTRPARLIIQDIKIANADWSADPTMFEASRIDLSFRWLPLLYARLELPELIVENPKLVLEKNQENRANWQFSQNPASLALDIAKPENRFEFPLIGHLMITDGQLIYRDPARGTNMNLAIATLVGENERDDQLQVQGKGTYQQQPFSITLTGGSILQLRESNAPYPFSLNIQSGDTSADLRGETKDPIKLQALNTSLAIKGGNAADLFPLTGIALPPTPPYHVTGHLTHHGDDSDARWDFTNFKGKMGNSDLNGTVSWFHNRTPPYFKGEFISQNLDMADLAGFIGADKQPDDNSRVIPDKSLDISRLTAMNADATFRSDHVRTPDILDDFSMVLHLENGTLVLEPLSFGTAGGKINANIKIEGLKEPPQTAITVNFSRLSLESLFAPLAKKYGEENVSAGLIGGQANLQGQGKSLRSMLATADGSIGLGMEGGQLSRLLLELAGLDLYKSIGLILTGDKPVNIRCVVGDFMAADGILTPRTFLIDTDVTQIEGKGIVNLKDESLDLSLRVHPKDASLFSARAPILVTGTLKEPAVGVDPAALAARGGAAAALGALLTPVGALLAFIEPGLGKDSNCAAFLQELNAKSGNKIPKNEK